MVQVCVCDIIDWVSYGGHVKLTYVGYVYTHSWRTLWVYAGPGWLMSIAYVDPGNLESDLQAGAYGGYQLIWVLFGSTVMGFFLQVLAARLGVVTGKNLAEMCTSEYPRWASLVLWVMTEIAIIGRCVLFIIRQYYWPSG